MKLSKRLLEIASLIKKDEIIADIGSDHGYLVKYLIENKIIKYGYCVEVSKGPYEATLNTIIDYKLDKAMVLLGNGLEPIKEISDISTIVIAGMGFNTIKQIISKNRNYLQNKRLILQSNNQVEELRRFCVANQLKIIAEKIIFEDFYYQILVVEACEMTNKLSEIEYKYGPFLIKEKSACFISYLNFIKQKKINILKGLDAENEKYNLLLGEIEQINLLINGE